jgi:hypothetical protein
VGYQGAGFESRREPRGTLRGVDNKRLPDRTVRHLPATRADANAVDVGWCG